MPIKARLLAGASACSPALGRIFRVFSHAPCLAPVPGSAILPLPAPLDRARQLRRLLARGKQGTASPPHPGPPMRNALPMHPQANAAIFSSDPQESCRRRALRKAAPAGRRSVPSAPWFGPMGRAVQSRRRNRCLLLPASRGNGRGRRKKASGRRPTEAGLLCGERGG